MAKKSIKPILADYPYAPNTREQKLLSGIDGGYLRIRPQPGKKKTVKTGAMADEDAKDFLM